MPLSQTHLSVLIARWTTKCVWDNGICFNSLNDAYQYINQLRFKLKHNDYEGVI